jgi:protein-tyrosine phosphatase
MGNICRSPSAQGVFEKTLRDKGLAHQFEVDSAGTHSYHIGHLPDVRSIECAAKRGIDLNTQRARQVKSRDINRFNFILTMDNDNYKNLLKLSSSEHKSKIYRMMDFAKNSHYTEVPDPYYGGSKGFDLVLDLLENASEGLLESIKK